MNESLNLVISSKNKAPNDTNSHVSIKLKEDIYISIDEELHICMQSFHMVKSFYSCQAGLNDHFQIIVRPKSAPNDEGIDNFFIPEGNYDVRTLMSEIIKITKSDEDLFQIKYDPKLNKYIYTNLFRPDFNIYIKCKTAGIFLGFENDVEYLISAQGTYSSTFINVAGYNNMIIKMGGDINIENTISNIYKNDYQYDKILGILNISDIAPMDSIVYEDNGSCMFKHKVNNQKISEFNIQIANENGSLFPQMADWILVLKFEKVRVKKEFEKMELLLNDMTYYMASVYAAMNIPSRITFQDLLEK